MNAIVDAVERALPGRAARVGLHEPTFEGNELSFLKECLDTTLVSSIGPFVERFERMLCELTGSAYAVATGTGTAALHVSLLLAGVAAGDEVLIPAFSFIATANAVTYCGAIPHFVDSDLQTLGVSPQKLADYLRTNTEISGGACVNRTTGRRIAALVPMHAFGHPVDLDPLIELCARHSIALVEDAAESLGSSYKGKHTGTLGKISALSFNGNKVVTTGGGGAILTQDPALARHAKHLTTTAKVPHAWSFFHDEVGFNYRLPNLNAALGCAQLERFSSLIEEKRILAARYFDSFSHVAGASMFREPVFARSNYWLNTLLLDGEPAQGNDEPSDDAGTRTRDALLETLNARGIMARPAWTLLHKLPMFRECPRTDLDGAIQLERRIINLPSSPSLARA